MTPFLKSAKLRPSEHPRLVASALTNWTCLSHWGFIWISRGFVINMTSSLPTKHHFTILFPSSTSDWGSQRSLVATPLRPGQGRLGDVHRHHAEAVTWRCLVANCSIGSFRFDSHPHGEKQKSPLSAALKMFLWTKGPSFLEDRREHISRSILDKQKKQGPPNAYKCCAKELSPQPILSDSRIEKRHFSKLWRTSLNMKTY